MTSHKRLVHVRTWEEFKTFAVTLRPRLLIYAEESAPLSRPPLGLRLFFATETCQYVFLDFAHGAAFKRTGLPVHSHENGARAFIDEEELKNFICSELNRKDISIISFGVLDYQISSS